MDEIELVKVVEKMWTQTWSKCLDYWHDYYHDRRYDLGGLVCVQHVPDTFTPLEAQLIENELGRRLPQIGRFEVVRTPDPTLLNVIDLTLT